MSSSHPHNRKRPMSSSDEQFSRACDQCRSRKVKCDRIQPECSNCQKAGVTCGFSDMLKRVNYAKRLHDEFSNVVARMERLESTVARLPEQIAQNLSAPSSVSNTTPATVNNNKSRQLLTCVRPSVLTPKEAVTKDEDAPSKWQPHFEKVRIAQGGERIVGYPAAITLFVSVKRHLIRALTATTRQQPTETDGQHYLTDLLQNKPFLKGDFQKQLQRFPFDGCNDPTGKYDGRALSTPPRTLLVPAIEYFLEYVNSYIPIFNETALRDMVDSHYADMENSRSQARSLILNCIIFLSLNNAARRNGITDSHMGTMGEDLIPSFRKNCDRALANIYEFTRPCQCNVQALMTLALVARDYYGCLVFEKVCQVASQVVRSTGLNLARRLPPTSWEEMNQSERLFWAMYMLDKQRVFLNGHPCDLYLFDSDLQLVSCHENATFHERLNAATVHLATILEEIFIALYSCRGARASGAHRSRQADVLRNSVNEWSLQHHSVIHQVSSREISPGSDPSQIELKYSYHTTQILINRCDTSADSQQQIIFHARSALKIIHALAGAQPLTVSHLVALERIFRNYPSVAFTDLLMGFLTKGVAGKEEDSFLLRSARDAYQVIHEPYTPAGVAERAYIGFNWCIDLLNLIESAERGGSNKISSTGYTYQPVNAMDTLGMSSNAYQMNMITPGHDMRSHCLPPGQGLPGGLPNEMSGIAANGSLEAGFFDYDFYQRLFQQESWDASSSL